MVAEGIFFANVKREFPLAAAILNKAIAVKTRTSVKVEGSAQERQ